MKAWFRTSTVTSRRTRLPKAVGSGGSDLDDVNLLQDDARTDSARQSQLSQEIRCSLSQEDGSLPIFEAGSGCTAPYFEPGLAGESAGHEPCKLRQRREWRRGRASCQGPGLWSRAAKTQLHGAADCSGGEGKRRAEDSHRGSLHALSRRVKSCFFNQQ